MSTTANAQFIDKLCLDRAIQIIDKMDKDYFFCSTAPEVELQCLLLSFLSDYNYHRKRLKEQDK